MTKKIFVLDDEDVVVALFRSMLTKAGYQVVTHTKSETALEKIRNTQPDLMVLDLSMPVKDGYELIDEIRAVPSLTGIPIIVVTASDSDYVIRKINSIGVQGFFNKPIVANEVLVKLGRLLN